MSAGKNPYLRYRILNKCFTSKTKKHWHWTELLEKLEENDIKISHRTLKYDLENMRYDRRLNYEAPIKFCKRNLAYYYEDSNFSIENIPISEEELKSLITATQLLEQHKGLPIFDQFEGVVDKLVTVVNQINKPRKKKSIDFEKSPYYKGVEHIEILMDKIESEQPLELTYKKFNGEKSNYILHPYLLKEYKKRWYLFGHNANRNIIAAFGLDRIEKIKDKNVPFISNTRFHAETYFKHTLGVTYKGEEPEKIVLSFNRQTAPYIRTQHIHETQKVIEENEEEIQVELQLVVNYELVSLILSYGKGVKVIEPASLREEIQKEIEDLKKLYN